MSAPTDDQAPPSGESPKPAGESQPPASPGPGQPPNSSPGAGGPESPAGERIQAIIAAAEKAAAGIIEDADAQARRYVDTSRQRADALADKRVRVMSDLTETLVRQAELVRRQSDDLLSALDGARNELAGQIGKELTMGSPAETGASAAPASQAAPTPAPEPPVAAPEPPVSEPPPGASRLPHLQPVEAQPPDLKSVESVPEPEPAAKPKPVESVPEPAPPSAEPVSQPPPAPPPPASQPIASTGKSATPSDGARLLAAQMAVAGSSRDEIEMRLRKEFGVEDAGPILDGILGPS